MKTCPSCGKELPDEASFCVYCMTQLSPVTEVSTEQTTHKSGSTLTRLLVLLCILLTVAVIILAVRIGNKADIHDDIQNDNQTFSKDEQYYALCQDLIDKMAQSGAALDEATDSSDILGCDFGDSYDSLDITEYGDSQNMEDEISVRTHLRFSAGDVFINYARHTDYARCWIIDVPEDNSQYTSPSLDAFKVMQLLFTVRTGSTNTDLYDFLRDNETYPLSDKYADWTDRYDYLTLWYDSVVNEDTQVSILRKDGQFENNNVTLLVRTRQYGDTAFYDYQFIMY